ncbi:hypothetical protein NBRC116601_10610 [Cognatishimia sp. WU-CL00825]|uniref:hypothetical protein n=1 Tax=Cognatishimia sp. WU-CL00825 TaxID=3127658 RepID=UPI003102728C
MAGKTYDFPDLKADCSACAALCCIALHFDKGDAFGFDKLAGVPCPNLAKSDFSCTIHQDLALAGFEGCIRFDCRGAGQAVTQDVFDGKDWRSHPNILGDMMTAFQIMRQLHKVLEILKLLSQLPLHKSEAQTLADLVDDFAPPDDGWTLEALEKLQTSGAFAHYQSALPSFRSVATDPNALAALQDPS